MSSIEFDGSRIEYVWTEPVEDRGAPPIVLLHEGLGSVSMWRDFPRVLAHTTHRRVLAYSRRGYGQSEPVGYPFDVSYMHEEALTHLSRLLDALDVRNPVLFGHSDGASIALIHAGSRTRPVSALVVEAPHVLVEDISIRSIRAAKHAFETTDLRLRLAKYHKDVDGAFWGWNDIWLSDAFLAWNIERFVAALRCPVLAIQGVNDEYGTLEQIEIIARTHPDTRLLPLSDCKHSPHRDQTSQVLVAVKNFLS